MLKTPPGRQPVQSGTWAKGLGGRVRRERARQQGEQRRYQTPSTALVKSTLMQPLNVRV